MSNGGATKILIILADYTMVLIGLGILTAAFFWQWTLSGEMIALIGGTIGLFSKCIADFHGFEFGSSRASQAKDQTIANMTVQPAPPPTTGT